MKVEWMPTVTQMELMIKANKIMIALIRGKITNDEAMKAYREIELRKGVYNETSRQTQKPANSPN